MEQAARRPASLRELFLVFTQLALQGFGGVLAVSEHVLVERKRWLTPAEYLDVFALCQVLPGPNVCNLALIVGDRFFGWRGGAVALAGLVAVPLAIVLALAVVYARFAHLPPIAGGLRAMGAVTAGLIIGTGLKLLPALQESPLGRPACALLIV